MNEKTKWLGLWKNRSGVYSGRTIKKADIPPYTRIIVRYNKFYEKDSNKPKYVYCFANGEASDAITVETTKGEYITMREADEMKEKVESLAEVMRAGNRNGWKMMLPSESQANCESLMRSAIEIIEELTGEEWNFTALTWG